METLSLHPWTVLLISGASGIGKSRAAAELALRVEASWLQVDDLRLALQFSHARFASDADTALLSFFLETPNVWSLPAESLRDALIAVGRVLMPAIEVVIEHHVGANTPTVIEGDGLLPALLDRPSIHRRIEDGRVKMICMEEPDETAIDANMRQRGRGIDSLADHRRQTHVHWLFGQWLVDEARRRTIPVIAAQPYASLVARILSTSHSSTE